MKFKIIVRVIEAKALFDILPPDKLLTYNLPADKDGLIEAVFTSAIGFQDFKKLMDQIINGSAMMESFKTSYD